MTFSDTTDVRGKPLDATPSPYICRCCCSQETVGRKKQQLPVPFDGQLPTQSSQHQLHQTASGMDALNQLPSHSIALRISLTLAYSLLPFLTGIHFLPPVSLRAWATACCHLCKCSARFLDAALLARLGLFFPNFLATSGRFARACAKSLHCTTCRAAATWAMAPLMVSIMARRA